MDASSAVERLRRAFRGRERGVAAVYLFGSVARGERRPGSDLDVAVLLEPAPERGTFESLRLDLRAELESDFGRDVGLVRWTTPLKPAVARSRWCGGACG